MTEIVLSPREKIEDILNIGAGASRWARWRPFLIGLALAIVAASGAFWWWSARDAATAVQYSTVAARRGGLTVTVSATGTVEPVNTVEVGSELSGTVRSVVVGYNDPVTVGQVLAEINTDKLAAQTERTRALLDAARAGAREGEAALAQAENELARIRPLAERDFASQQELQSAETARTRAEAALVT